MNVVHELGQLDRGGAERVVRNIVQYDEKNKHHIIAYKNGNYRDALIDSGANVVVLDEESDVEMDQECDILHIHCGGGLSPLAKDLAGQFPIIETIHSPIRSPNSSRIITQRVGVSRAVADMNDKAVTIHNGIDLDDMEPTKTAKEIKAELGIMGTVVGRLGRLGRDKGLEEWILACYYLKKEGINFTPVIVGGEARNCEGYRGKLKLMCESLSLQKVVWLPEQENIANYLQIMDVFLYPSATEGFGMTFIEALLCGCVVVSYDTPVNKEIIGGYSILTKQSEGIPGLVRGVKTALQDEVRDALRGEQTEFVLAQYQAETMSLNYQELYERYNVDFNRKNESQEEHFVSS